MESPREGPPAQDRSAWSPSAWAQVLTQGVHVVYPVMLMGLYSCGGAWPRADTLLLASHT